MSPQLPDSLTNGMPIGSFVTVIQDSTGVLTLYKQSSNQWIAYSGHADTEPNLIWLSIVFFALSALCYGIISLYWHSKLKWMSIGARFWGQLSWTRKYMKLDTYHAQDKPPDNWYYRFFKIKYKERFPGSATIFVFVTDGFHAVQFLMLAFFSLSIALQSNHIILTFILIRIVFGIAFTLTYKWLSK